MDEVAQNALQRAQLRHGDSPDRATPGSPTSGGGGDGYDPMHVDSPPPSAPNDATTAPLREFFVTMRHAGAPRAGRWRHWASRRHNARINWDAQRDALVDVYLALLKSHSGSGAPSPVPYDSSRAASLSGRVRDPGCVLLIDISDVQSVPGSALAQGSRNASLLHHGYLGSSPVSPEIAFSVRLLQQYVAMHKRARTGKQGFVRALCDIHNTLDTGSLLARFSETVDEFRNILDVIDRRVHIALNRTGDWRRKNSCPPCSYKCEDEPALRFARQLTMDGNNSLKRFISAALPDDVMYASDYVLPRATVEECADEVQPRSHARRAPAPPTTSSSTLPDTDTGADASADGPVDATGNVQSECAERWRNARPEAQKGMSWEALDETGYFACVCRHGLVFAVCDMIRSGELAKYGLAMDREIIRCFKDEGTTQLGYDINCAHSVTASRSSFGGAYMRFIHAVVGTFHGHAHGRSCQLCSHPLYILGSGREPFEGCEQLYAFSNRFAYMMQHATAYGRHRDMHSLLLTWDSDKYTALGQLLLGKHRDALNKVAESNAVLATTTFRFSDTEYETMLQDEREFLKSKVSATPVEAREKLLDQYADVLTQMWKAEDKRSALPAPSARARPLLRAWAHAPAADKAYIAANRAVLLLAVQAATLEQDLDLERWTRGSHDYVQAVNARTVRQCDAALHDLEVAVISRVLELEKANMRDTGYKMRKFIAREIGRRTGAVKKLVDKYNRLASAVEPVPRRTVTYEEVVDAAYLADFPLLRYDTGDAAWAQPLFRKMLRAWAEKKRAEEEIIRCRVESVRLRTWIRDEEDFQDRHIEDLARREDPRDRLLAHELDSRAQRLFHVHSKILNDLHVLDIADGHTDANGQPGPRQAGRHMGDTEVHAQVLRPRTRTCVLNSGEPGEPYQPRDEVQASQVDDDDEDSMDEGDAVELSAFHDVLGRIAS